MKTQRMLPALILATLSGMAQADINIGVSVSATGPAASLGIPEKNTFAILPTSIAGEKINYIVLDDGTDPGQATKNARKLVTEDKVDVLVGSSSTPACAAMAEVAGLKAELDASATRLDAIQTEMQTLLLAVPNLPHDRRPA